eukprot:1145409-Pelagomonas_calceolata.AAC.3
MQAAECSCIYEGEAGPGSSCLGICFGMTPGMWQCHWGLGRSAWVCTEIHARLLLQCAVKPIVNAATIQELANNY